MDAAPGGRPYNICSGRAWRIGDLLEELLQLSRGPGAHRGGSSSGCGRTTFPSSRATPRGFAPSSAGRRAIPVEQTLRRHARVVARTRCAPPGELPMGARRGKSAGRSSTSLVGGVGAAAALADVVAGGARRRSPPCCSICCPAAADRAGAVSTWRSRRAAGTSGIVLYPLAVLGARALLPRTARHRRGGVGDPRGRRRLRDARRRARAHRRRCPWNRAKSVGRTCRVHRLRRAGRASALAVWTDARPRMRCRAGGSSRRRPWRRSSRGFVETAPIRLERQHLGAGHGGARAVER